LSFKTKNMNRDQQLISLRPSIPVLVEDGVTSAMEQFQNKSLRPILKLQNGLLLQLFRNYAIKRKGAFFAVPVSQKRAYIEKSLQRDLRFRSLMQGIIIGQFTIDELANYEQEESELSRRMIGMMIQRIHSQWEEIQPAE